MYSSFSYLAPEQNRTNSKIIESKSKELGRIITEQIQKKVPAKCAHKNTKR